LYNVPSYICVKRLCKNNGAAVAPVSVQSANGCVNLDSKFGTICRRPLLFAELRGSSILAVYAENLRIGVELEVPPSELDQPPLSSAVRFDRNGPNLKRLGAIRSWSRTWGNSSVLVGMVDYVAGGLLDVFYEITEKSRLHVIL